jgi:hypothetical protein
MESATVIPDERPGRRRVGRSVQGSDLHHDARPAEGAVDKVVRGAVSGKPVAGSEPLTDLVATGS